MKIEGTEGTGRIAARFGGSELKHIHDILEVGLIHYSIYIRYMVVEGLTTRDTGRPLIW